MKPNEIFKIDESRTLDTPRSDYRIPSKRYFTENTKIITRMVYNILKQKVNKDISLVSYTLSFDNILYIKVSFEYEEGLFAKHVYKIMIEDLYKEALDELEPAIRTLPTAELHSEWLSAIALSMVYIHLPLEGNWCFRGARR